MLSKPRRDCVRIETNHRPDADIRDAPIRDILINGRPAHPEKRNQLRSRKQPLQLFDLRCQVARRIGHLDQHLVSLRPLAGARD